MCERRLHREREEDDAGHHRQVQIGVDVARKGGALDAASVGEQLLPPDREEVEVRQPERRRDHEPEHGCDDHPGGEPDASLPEADGDEGLADRDDHDQPVTLDEVRRLDPPAADPGEQRSDEADDDGGQPQQRLGLSVDEPGGDDQCRAGEGPRSDSQDRRQEVSITPCCERVEREMHDGDDQEGNAESDTVTAERIRDRQRGDEHRPHRDQHRPPHSTHIRDRRCWSTRHRPPKPTRARRGSADRARGHSRSDCSTGPS